MYKQHIKKLYMLLKTTQEMKDNNAKEKVNITIK